MAVLVYVSNLVLVVLLVNLENLLTCFVAIHDWHIDVQDNNIKMHGLIYLLVLLFTALFLLVFTAIAISLHPPKMIIKLSHVVLYGSDRQVPINCSDNINLFELSHSLLHHQ